MRLPRDFVPHNDTLFCHPELSEGSQKDSRGSVAKNENDERNEKNKRNNKRVRGGNS